MTDFKWPEEMMLIGFICYNCGDEFSVEEDRSEKPSCPQCYAESKRDHKWVGSMTCVPFTVEGILRAIVAQMKKR